MIRSLWSRPLVTAYRVSSSQPTRWFCASKPHSSEKLLYPENRTSSQHRDLATFLAYAKRTGLDEKSTVFVGTHYEYTIAGTLSRYGFSLRRVGGASDCGVDLLGTWTPPRTDGMMRTLVQCKAGVQRVGPNLIRELEGAFVGAPVGWRGSGVLGLLASERPATKGVRESMGRSRWPMGYLCCSREGVLKQMIWNHRAEEEGLEGFGVATRHVDGQEGEAELILLRNGKVLPLLDRT
ncbi:unnamed protein product [Clonostachys rosea]|uniref:Uncharacterized protein n=1 Tax=Bionectria ochroleuca TaxID=29856 RepID=A0ABY6U2Z8_BIOOC|nr:unnamed protein product [Clonostachys rosea]